MIHPVVEAALLVSRVKWSVDADGRARPYSYGEAVADAHTVVLTALGVLAVEFSKRAHEAGDTGRRAEMWRQAHDAICLVIEEVNGGS